MNGILIYDQVDQYLGLEKVSPHYGAQTRFGEGESSGYQDEHSSMADEILVCSFDGQNGYDFVEVGLAR